MIWTILFWIWLVLGIITGGLHLWMARSQFGWGIIILSILVGFIPPFTYGFLSQLFEFVKEYRSWH